MAARLLGNAARATALVASGTSRPEPAPLTPDHPVLWPNDDHNPGYRRSGFTRRPLATARPHTFTQLGNRVIEGWYNSRHLHSSFGYRSPTEYAATSQPDRQNQPVRQSGSSPSVSASPVKASSQANAWDVQMGDRAQPQLLRARSNALLISISPAPNESSPVVEVRSLPRVFCHTGWLVLLS